MKVRRILFWIHLSAGTLAGCVIFVMSVTGVMLAFQRQIVQWSDSRYRIASIFDERRIPIDALANNLRSSSGTHFSSITLRSDPHAPVEFGFGRDRVVFVNPYTGAILGESHSLRAFFVKVENMHRWLGMSAGMRSSGHAITGACTLIFLLLIVSGPILWWPKQLTWANLQKIVVPGRGLSGRAFFWNLHNVLGIWCALPLFVVALSGVVMSYGWATNLVYRATGNQPPSQAQTAGVRLQENSTSHSDQSRVAQGAAAPERRGAADSMPPLVRPDAPVPLDLLFAAASRKTRDWWSITMRPSPGKNIETTFVIDAGDGGRPDLRSVLTLNRDTGEIMRWEPFSSYNAGRRLRTWFRFSHTGEAFGIPGETLAALASASAAMLAFSGLTMSWMRFRRRNNPDRRVNRLYVSDVRETSNPV